MRILPPEEANNISPTNGKTTFVRSALLQLKPGEALVVEKKDWQGKRPPYNIALYLMKTTSLTFTYGRMHDGSGWIFKRVE